MSILHNKRDRKGLCVSSAQGAARHRLAWAYRARAPREVELSVGGRVAVQSSVIGGSSLGYHLVSSPLRSIKCSLQEFARLGSAAPGEPLFANLALMLAGNKCLNVRNSTNDPAAAPTTIVDLARKYPYAGGDIREGSAVGPHHRRCDVPHQRFARGLRVLSLRYGRHDTVARLRRGSAGNIYSRRPMQENHRHALRRLPFLLVVPVEPFMANQDVAKLLEQLLLCFWLEGSLWNSHVN